MQRTPSGGEIFHFFCDIKSVRRIYIISHVNVTYIKPANHWIGYGLFENGATSCYFPESKMNNIHQKRILNGKGTAYWSSKTKDAVQLRCSYITLHAIPIIEWYLNKNGGWECQHITELNWVRLLLLPGTTSETLNKYCWQVWVFPSPYVIDNGYSE